jgi:hypothetical protein
MSETMLLRAKSALREAYVRCNGSDSLGAWGEPYEGYARTVTDNLVGSAFLELCHQDFEDGKGQELLAGNGHPPKMAAVYSSSALVVNTFGPWRHDPRGLRIHGHDGTIMRFEVQCPTGLKGTPPHLDVRLDGPNTTLGIESKCLEYLTPKSAEFRLAYNTIVGPRAQSRWFQQIAVLRENPNQYYYLDVAQLIKHYLGLSYNAAGRSTSLLYLFWEPVNWEDFSAFTDHRDEIARFTDSVGGDPVTFQAMSYLDLWKEWETRPPFTPFPDHLKTLIARYRVVI